MSFKFGLNVKNKGLGVVNKPSPGKRKPLLGGDDDDDTKVKANVQGGGIEIGGLDFQESTALPSEPSEPVKPTKSSKSNDPPTGPPIRKVKAKDDDPSALGNVASIQESEKRAKQATEIDSAIYDYDAAYDALHAKTVARKAAEREDALQRRPKYMDKLFESAEMRKKDELRARDKLLQREREEEGDEFADKEKFVTGAYKTQQEETRKAEEEEKKRQELEEEKMRKSGMQGFHRQMLMEQEQRHQEAQAAMEAAAELAKNGVKPEVQEPQEKSAAEIAKELAEKGKSVAVNDDGQVVDKRQLLTAGLNVVAKPKPTTPTTSTSARPGGGQSGYQGRSSNQRAVRERQTALVAEQIEQSAKRKAEEEAEEQTKLQRASKSQKTEKDISSAKERYLQRKREAAAAKAAGK